MSAKSYLDRGVSATKDDVKKAVINQDKGIFPGAFCKILPDIALDPDYCFAIHADGAGTKSSAAYLMYEETKDIKVFEGIAQDSLVMNTDDLGAIGATDNFILSNTIGRNAHRISGKAIAQVISGYDNIIKTMKNYGVNIVMAGGETADVGDIVKTLILDSTIAVRMKRSEVIDASNIIAGDIIVGLSSSGQAVYEVRENSGIGSNGLTAARHALLSKYYLTKYPESVSETIPENKIYCGKYKLEDSLAGSDLSIGEAILSPTRTYIPILKKIFEKIPGTEIHGIIHCTGGGQVKCRDFGVNVRYVKDSLFVRPAIFEAIAQSGQIPEKEMYQIFNMGHRMEIYCSREIAPVIIEISKLFSVEAKIVGYVEDSRKKGNEVIIKDRKQEFVY